MSRQDFSLYATSQEFGVTKHYEETTRTAVYVLTLAFPSTEDSIRLDRKQALRRTALCRPAVLARPGTAQAPV